MIRTKIIATIGPATETVERLGDLFEVGLDVCRLNFSHGTLDEHGLRLARVREAARAHGTTVCVFGDLCGPKLRLGSFADGGTLLETGQPVEFVRGDGPCTAEHFTVSWSSFVDEVDVGERIYIDDGLVRLLVTERRQDRLLCTCTVGGRVSSHKGVNLPDTDLATPALTDKDRADLAWAVKQDLDYVALSFVRRPADLRELKQLIADAGSDLRVIIKVEKTEALEHLEALIEETDAVLVARGDLGVETDIWRVPLIQKDLVRRCQKAGKPVIVATQMLQSMVESPIPTRAEVSDVANAIFDRADAVMLSAESAIGQYPSLAVDMMNRIAAATEEYLATCEPFDPAVEAAALADPTLAIAHSAVRAALDVKARAVAVWTATGRSVRALARYRLPMPVLGLSYDTRVLQQMNLSYGVVPVRVEPLDHPAKMAAALDAELLDEAESDVRGLVAAGDLIVVVTSTRAHAPGATDTVLVHRVGSSR